VNHAALRAAVRNRMGNPADDALFTDGVVTDLVNAALHYLETEHDWAWLEAVETIATIAATGTYALAATYGRSISLTSGGFPLKRVTVEELELLRDAAGPPKMWAAYGNQLELVPVPTGVANLRHRFIRTEPDLAADGDTPLMPARWHQAVVDYAANLGYRREGNLQEAGSALAAYEAWLEQMRREASRYSRDDGGGEPVAMPTDEAPTPAGRR
jgi:hypothetical protein